MSPFFFLCLICTLISFASAFRSQHFTKSWHTTLIDSRVLNNQQQKLKLLSNSRLNKRHSAQFLSSSINPDDDESDSNASLSATEELKKVLRGTCVMFVGMMGSGKSTIGDAFARRMGYRFLDTDEIAEHMIEMPVADYFALGKEQEFRKLEYEILMELAQYTRVVIATGGGIVMKQENWGLLRHGIVVHLDVDTATIVERLRADPSQLQRRPLLREDDPKAKLDELLEQRKDKYAMADVQVAVPSSLQDKEAVVDIVIESILQEIKSNPPLWSSWKAQHDKRALEMAAVVNPSAINSSDKLTAAARAQAGGNGGKKGSIQYVSLSDIQSGKVKLPNSNSGTQEMPIIEGLPKADDE